MLNEAMSEIEDRNTCKNV